MQTRQQLELGSATGTVATIGVPPGTVRERRALLIPSARLRQPIPAFLLSPGGIYTHIRPHRRGCSVSLCLCGKNKNRLKNMGKPGKNRPQPT